MLDIGWQEFFIVAIIAVIVIGPKDLPRALKTIAQFVRKARSYAREFQNGLDDMMREAELEDIKKEITGAVPSDLAKEIENSIDPTGDLTETMRKIDPTAEVRDALDTKKKPKSGTKKAKGASTDKADETKNETPARVPPPVAEDGAEPARKTQAGE